MGSGVLVPGILESMPDLSAATLAATLLGIAYLALQLRALRASQNQLQEKYRDALVALSGRADAAEKLAEQLTSGLRAIERTDRQTIASALAAANAQVPYLQERLTETQRALVSLTDAKVGATVAGQTLRKSVPEEVVEERPVRWAAASGTYAPRGVSLGDMLRARSETATLIDPFIAKPIPDPSESN